MSDSPYISGEWVTDLGTELINVHTLEECCFPCPIHNSPSDHPLKNAPRDFDAIVSVMVRICEHGYRHYDVDSVAVKSKTEIHEQWADPIKCHCTCGCCR